MSLLSVIQRFCEEVNIDVPSQVVSTTDPQIKQIKALLNRECIDLAGRGDEMSEYFFGINYFFYGHKLKWQNAFQYTEMDNLGSKVYEGWGYTSGLRISW